MNNEEKARAYDAALKDMKAIYPNLKGDIKLAVEHAFPQPTKSEDEKIRKELLKEIEFITPRDGETDSEGLILPSYRARIDKYRTYLEKQKEQKLESCDCSRDEESYINGIHHVLMNPEAYGLIKQKPAEWSEEDEENMQAIVDTIKMHWLTLPGNTLIDWLKSLRPVSKESLQRHWKPSEEQPEMDLEKFTEKMDAWKARYNYPNNIPIKAAMAFTARMFYQYPNVARQWYDSLPKATMD